MARTLVDIGDNDLKALDDLAATKNVSRASLIRKAVSAFLEQSSVDHRSQAFGLWGDRKVDGLAYQEEIRGEW
ncbi:ribbon-helix-helix protein, CopG family [Rhizobium grahamii]|uniref:Ribbon-helix-helix protein, CopG family n=1 Tax=Rhizobium grahamii TaxID=1120045 RepID=A0A5Q0C0H7_9HYPH|nr:MULTISPECIES: CopG family transcriptional regulator [Rhizobium]QFY59376.1 ribbon-helix-helix protein, CopG family [Rhizobium grahamii]QRM48097.1 ribbon-helix-helix protein, CopG family [Rhizobium sp. BG6]